MMNYTFIQFYFKSSIFDKRQILFQTRQVKFNYNNSHMLKIALSKAFTYSKITSNLLFSCSKAKTSSKSAPNQKKNPKLTISEIIQAEFGWLENGKEAEKPQKIDPQALLNSHVLQKCTPLMRKILAGAAPKHLQQAQLKIAQQQQQKQLNTVNPHDLQNFHHMLASPLANQAALDKFCEKKKCPIILDVKYDGERTLISFQRDHDIEMVSRNGKSQSINYQILRQRIQKQLLQTNISSIKLDGEIVIVDKQTLNPLPFSGLQRLKRFKDKDNNIEDWEIQLEGKEIFIYIFDIVQLNGQNLMTKPLIQRRQLIPKISIFKEVEHQIIHFPEERAKIFTYFKQVLERKYEGIILKGAKDLYYTNDSRVHWKKLKRGFINTRDPNISKVELDLVLMGANRGKAFKNNNIFTSFLMGTPHNNKIVPISNVGTGFTDQILKDLTEMLLKKVKLNEIPEEYDLKGIKADVYFSPELVFEIHAQEFTLSPSFNLGRDIYGGLSLRFPTFQRIRYDKDVKQATKGEQILQLSKSFNLNIPK